MHVNRFSHNFSSISYWKDGCLLKISNSKVFMPMLRVRKAILFILFSLTLVFIIKEVVHEYCFLLFPSSLGSNIHSLYLFLLNFLSSLFYQKLLLILCLLNQLFSNKNLINYFHMGHSSFFHRFLIHKVRKLKVV